MDCLKKRCSTTLDFSFCSAKTRYSQNIKEILFLEIKRNSHDPWDHRFST